MNIFTLFQRAQAGHDLTPAERAFFKFVQAVGYIIIINALVAVFQYLNNTHGTIDIAKLIEFAGAQVGLALALSVGKYFSAHGDATLGSYIDMIVDEVITRLPAQPAPLKPVVPDEHPPVVLPPALPVPAHILAATPSAVNINPALSAVNVTPPVQTIVTYPTSAPAASTFVPAYLGDTGQAPAPTPVVPAPSQPAESAPVTPAQ